MRLTVAVGLVAIALLGGPIRAQGDLDARIDHELPGLLATYRQLHAAPELSGHEDQTSALVARELRALGYTVTDHLGTYTDPALTGFGVVGVLKNGPGPTVLFRTELDALPVTEKTGLPYASTVEATGPDGQKVGVMHACGHDIHMASFIGTARMLAGDKTAWHGTLIMLGQPAEEISLGAAALLRDNLYQRVGQPDYILSRPRLVGCQAGHDRRKLRPPALRWPISTRSTSTIPRHRQPRGRFPITRRIPSCSRPSWCSRSRPS